MTDIATQPFFVLGCRRSGTTMFRLMLACHPDLGVPPEGGFIAQLGWIFDKRRMQLRDATRFVDKLLMIDAMSDWQLDRAKLLGRIEQLLPAPYPVVVDAVYRTYLASRFPGASVWGDKTTWYHDYLHQLDSYFPGARYIHIVRDPRGVAASFKSVKHLPSDVADSAAEWLWTVASIRRLARRTSGRFMQLHYEELVRKPAETLTMVCEFLGIKYHEDMVRFGEVNSTKALEPVRHMRWKAMTSHLPAESRCDAWQRDLTAHEQAIICGLASGMMAKYGYDAPAGDTDVRTRLWSDGLLAVGFARRFLRRELRPLKASSSQIAKRLLEIH